MIQLMKKITNKITSSIILHSMKYSHHDPLGFNLRLHLKCAENAPRKVASKDTLIKNFEEILHQIAINEKNTNHNTIEKLNYTNILGSPVASYNLRDTFQLFNEIFLDSVYSFESNNQTPTIIDCGSNIGVSIIYFKKLYPQSKIIGIEASKGCFEILEHNITKNNFSNITLINKAIANYDGFCVFEDPSHGKGSGLSHIQNHETLHDNKKIECFKLSNIINEKIDFLKIDIEGGEWNLLDDLDKMEKLHLIDQMAIEVHIHVPGNPQEQLSQLFSILEKNNFSYQFRAFWETHFNFPRPQAFIIYAKNRSFNKKK